MSPNSFCEGPKFFVLGWNEVAWSAGALDQHWYRGLDGDGQVIWANDFYVV